MRSFVKKHCTLKYLATALELFFSSASFTAEHYTTFAVLLSFFSAWRIFVHIKFNKIHIKNGMLRQFITYFASEFNFIDDFNFCIINPVTNLNPNNFFPKNFVLAYAFMYIYLLCEMFNKQFYWIIKNWHIYRH